MTKKWNRGLWTVQVLLALLYLFAGSMKLILPIAEMTKQIALPGAFLRFIGTAEVLGSLGLVLPGLLGTRRELTPLAAIGLSMIMAGASLLMFHYSGAGAAATPFAVGLLDGLVVWGRGDSMKQNGRILCWSPSQS